MSLDKVVIEGDTGDPEYDYAPRWKYLALDNHRIQGSEDGILLEVIFDGHAEQWMGGGFFTAYPDERPMVAYRGDIDNEFTSTSAYVVARSANQDYCEKFGGITVCPNDDSYSVNEKEYYKGGIGPLGYYLYTHFASSGGGFYTSFTRTRHVGLTATSLSAIDGFVPQKRPWTYAASLLAPSSGHSAQK